MWIHKLQLKLPLLSRPFSGFSSTGAVSGLDSDVTPIVPSMRDEVSPSSFSLTGSWGVVPALAACPPAQGDDN